MKSKVDIQLFATWAKGFLAEKEIEGSGNFDEYFDRIKKQVCVDKGLSSNYDFSNGEIEVDELYYNHLRQILSNLLKDAGVELPVSLDDVEKLFERISFFVKEHPSFLDTLVKIRFILTTIEEKGTSPFELPEEALSAYHDLDALLREFYR